MKIIVACGMYINVGIQQNMLHIWYECSFATVGESHVHANADTSVPIPSVASKTIIESVDCICRDSMDTQIWQYKLKFQKW